MEGDGGLTSARATLAMWQSAESDTLAVVQERKMGTTGRTGSHRSTQRSLIEAAGAFAAFCGLSLVSRLVLPVFLLVVIAGIAFPLVWARLRGDWAAIGFTRRRIGQALLWGAGAGLLGVVYVYVGARNDPLPAPPMLGLQLAVGIPVAFLILSPFQEFFFRGWLQPRLETALGRWIGLLVTSVGFSLWHLLPPFEGTPTSQLSVSSLEGILTTLGMGLVFGYAFQRTRNIVAPWLAHALMIIAAVAVGGMTFVQYAP